MRIHDRHPPRLRFVVFTPALLAGLLCAGTASAQIDNRLALGASVTTRLAESTESAGSSTLGLEIRLGHQHDGWGWQYSFFSWFDTGVTLPVNGRTTDLGSIRMRPVMIGYGYTRVRGRATFTGDLLGGYSFNSFHLDPVAAAVYAAGTDPTRIEAEASNTFVVKPEVQVWYDVSKRIGVKGSLGYLVAHPDLVVTGPFGEDRRSIKANTFLFTIGVVYSIF